MVSPQKENGYTPVANEILDAVLSRKFSKRQDRILNIIWRFSYGCSKKKAYIDQMQDFNMYGIASTVIAKELQALEMLKVLSVDWDAGEVAFNKNYDTWDVPLHKDFDSTRHKYLIAANLNPEKRSQKGWNSSRRGGGRPISETGRCGDIIQEILYGTDDIKKLYSAYLSTKHWRYTRQKKIDSTNGKCEDCGADHELDVHHLNYALLGRESIINLVTLCRSCHSKKHNLISLHPVEQLGLQRDNLLKQARFTNTKPTGLLKDNLQVCKKITYAPPKASDGVVLQAAKTSRKQVERKEEKKDPYITVNILNKREAEDFGFVLVKSYPGCCNPNIERHMDILQKIGAERKDKAIELVKEAKVEHVSYVEVMEWVADRMEIPKQSN